MKKNIKTYTDLPLEEGKVYLTKFQTQDKFKIEKIKKNNLGKIIRIEGFYVGREDLGLCPLSEDRIFAEKIESGEICVCHKCGEPIED
jgi:hypothetical protein